MIARTKRTSAFPIIVLLALVLWMCAACAPLLTENLYMAQLYTDYAGTLDLPSASQLGRAVAVENDGDAYVSYYNSDYDVYSYEIYKVNLDGSIKTFARDFHTNPTGLAVDGAGFVFAIVDSYTIEKISPSGDRIDFATWYYSSLQGIAISDTGDVYATDSSGNILKITASGSVSTLKTVTGDPEGIAVGRDGYLYVANVSRHVIHKISSSGVETVFAGSGSAGSSDGSGTAASFKYPQGIALDSSGNVYVADSDNYLVRKITPGGLVTTLAGSGTSASINGIGLGASFSHPVGIAVDGSGYIFLTDLGSENTLRVIL